MSKGFVMEDARMVADEAAAELANKGDEVGSVLRVWRGVVGRLV